MPALCWMSRTTVLGRHSAIACASSRGLPLDDTKLDVPDFGQDATQMFAHRFHFVRHQHSYSRLHPQGSGTLHARFAHAKHA